MSIEHVHSVRDKARVTVIESSEMQTAYMEESMLTKTTLYRIVVSLGIAALLATAATSTHAARGSGSVGVGPGIFNFGKSPDEAARSKYEDAIKARERAAAHEAKAARMTDEQKRQKYSEKAREQYEKVIEKLQEAVEKKPDYHQAWTELGYAYYKTGDTEGSFRAYDRALLLEPNYAEAIEYRAETYLGMNQLDEAKRAYMHLFARRRELADQLMAAMQSWVVQKQKNPDGLDPRVVEDFAAWVAHRRDLAQQTA